MLPANAADVNSETVRPAVRGWPFYFVLPPSLLRFRTSPSFQLLALPHCRKPNDHRLRTVTVRTKAAANLDFTCLSAAKVTSWPDELQPGTPLSAPSPKRPKLPALPPVQWRCRVPIALAPVGAAFTLAAAPAVPLRAVRQTLVCPNPEPLPGEEGRHRLTEPIQPRAGRLCILLADEPARWHDGSWLTTQAESRDFANEVCHEAATRFVSCTLLIMGVAFIAIRFSGFREGYERIRTPFFLVAPFLLPRAANYLPIDSSLTSARRRNQRRSSEGKAAAYVRRHLRRPRCGRRIPSAPGAGVPYSPFRRLHGSAPSTAVRRYG